MSEKYVRKEAFWKIPCSQIYTTIQVIYRQKTDYGAD